ncbi:MAG: MFS transporter [Desulfobacteraceae bacterium]|nr:MFS transporter [Desulfobacteraceae bacterium]
MSVNAVADPTDDSVPRPFRTGGVLAISVAHFIHDMYTSFLSPLLPLFIEKLSLSLTQAGFLTTIMQLPSLINPYIGIVADRISVRWMVILAPSLTAVAMSLIGLSGSYGMLLLLLFVTGIGVAVFHVPSPVMVSRLSGDKKGKGMSFFMTGGELARTLGPIVAVAAVASVGLENLYVLMVFGLLISTWLFFQLKETPANIPRQGNRTVAGAWKTSRHVLIPLTGILTARGFMHASMVVFLPTYIMGETGNLWLAGSALTLFEACGVAGVLLAGPLSDRLGRRTLLMISLIGAPISIMVFALSGGILRIIALIAAGFTVLSTTPVMLALVQENAGDTPAAANGLFMMISFMARSAIVILVGWVADTIGLQTTYALSAFLGLFGLPFVFKLPKVENRI